MKLFVPVIFFAFFGILTNSTFAQQKNLSSLVVTRNKVFTIKIPSNASTGYSWVLSDSLDTKYLKKVAEVYKDDPNSAGIMGAAGTQIFSFKALKTGTAKINLVYMRSWETTIPGDADRRSYKIRIK
ncbi:MAG: Proteinase inhibitor chagasin [Segetibacter sp.]|nr:Proteinase inhibitor chagasin [Segetibacter sp.]